MMSTTKVMDGCFAQQEDLLNRYKHNITLLTDIRWHVERKMYSIQ